MSAAKGTDYDWAAEYLYGGQMVARALKGIPTLVSKIKPYEVYKPHFDNLRRISLENSSNWSKRRGWVNKVKNIPEDIQLSLIHI